MPVSKADQSNQPKEILGLRRITKKLLLDLCKKNKLYQTPRLNDVLYLHYQGFQSIEELEEYTELKCLWLECNAISEIRGLECQSKLKCLFLQSNLIKRIENLQYCKELDTLNLSQNHINRIENCGSDILPVLNTLNLSSNYIRDAEGIKELQNCKTLSVLDLSNNRIDDILIVKVFAKMPELKVLVLSGNPVVSKIPQYRKTLILECKKLTYLDSRPVFPKDRACAEAWKRGGYAEERKEHEKWNRQERQKITDSVNATIRMRNKFLKAEDQIDLLPNTDSEDGEGHELKPRRSIQLHQEASEMDLWDEVTEEDDYLQQTSSESNVSDISSGIKSKDSQDCSSEHVKSSESNKSLNPTDANIHSEKSNKDSLEPAVQDYYLKLIDDIAVDLDHDLQPTSSESTVSDTSSGIKSNESSDWSSQYANSSESNESLNPNEITVHSDKLKEDSTLPDLQDDCLKLINDTLVANDSYNKLINDNEDRKCDEVHVSTDDSSFEADEENVIQKFIKNVPEILADTPEDLETKSASYAAVDTKLDIKEDDLSIDFDFTNDEEDYALLNVIEVTTNNSEEICKKVIRSNNDNISNKDPDSKSTTDVPEMENKEKINEEFQRNFEELSANMDKYLSECYKELNGNHLIETGNVDEALDDINQIKDMDSVSDDESSSTSEDRDENKENVQGVASRWHLISKYVKEHRLEKELSKYLASQQTENLSNEIYNLEPNLPKLSPNILQTKVWPRVIPKIYINDKPLGMEFDNFEIPFPPDASESNLLNITITDNSEEESKGKTKCESMENLDIDLNNDSNELPEVNEYLEKIPNQATNKSSCDLNEELAEINKCLEITSNLDNGKQYVGGAIEELPDERLEIMSSMDTERLNDSMRTEKLSEIKECLEISSNTDTEKLGNAMAAKKLSEINKSLEINKDLEITFNTDIEKKLEETLGANKCSEVMPNEGNEQSYSDILGKSQSEVIASTRDVMKGFEYMPLDVSDLLRRSELNLKINSQNQEELNTILKEIEQENEEKYQLNTEETKSNSDLESDSVQTVCQELIVEIIESLDFTNMEVVKTKNYQIDPMELNEEYCCNDTSDEISTPSSICLPTVLNSFKDFINNIESGNRLLYYESHGKRRNRIRTSAAEKTACLQFLIKQKHLSDFNKDSAASLNAQLCKLYTKRIENVRRMVDRVYAQKDKYDDTLELIDGKLMVVKKTGEIEDYLPCQSAINNDLNEFDKILDTDIKSYANSLVPVKEESPRSNMKVSLSIDWNLIKQSQNSWFSICKRHLSLGNLKNLKNVTCNSKKGGDNLQLCKFRNEEQLCSLTPPIRSQIFDNIDKEFVKKLNFDNIDVNKEEDDQEVQCSRSYEELKDIITLNEVKEQTVNFTKEENELIEQISKGIPTGAVLVNNKEDLNLENIPEEDIALQKILKKTKEKDELDRKKIEETENPKDPTVDDNDRFPCLTKMQGIKLYEYKAPDIPEADTKCLSTVDANLASLYNDFGSDEGAQPELTGANIFTFVYQEEDNDNVEKDNSG